MLTDTNNGFDVCARARFARVCVRIFSRFIVWFYETVKKQFIDVDDSPWNYEEE